MFKAVQELSRRKFENPYVHDEKGRKVTSPQEIYTIIHEHFKKQFSVPTEEEMEPFDGLPRPLNNKIRVEEVRKNMMKLKNNRSADHKRITAEMMKYGPDELIKIIALVLKDIFEKHRDVDTGSGILTPINKPNKTKGPVTNLRAITLLPMIRKVMSIITLERINGRTEQYLSWSQSAYREFRSTSDIIWAHRWLVSRIEIYQENFI